MAKVPEAIYTTKPCALTIGGDVCQVAVKPGIGAEKFPFWRTSTEP